MAKVKDSVQQLCMIDLLDKKELRRRFSQLRSELKNTEKDRRITERLLSLDIIKKADILLMYASFGSEADTWAAAEKLARSNVILAYPLCGKDSEMTFHIVDSADCLSPGKYGIPEPDKGLPVPLLTENSVCIMPGLAFTENGGRLGYGGGYYDRFLAKNSYIKRVAMTYDGLIVPVLPLMPHDIRTDMIITEERTVFCNAE